MKKTLIAMMATLFVSFALVACSADSVSGSWDEGVVDTSLCSDAAEE